MEVMTKGEGGGAELGAAGLFGVGWEEGVGFSFLEGLGEGEGGGGKEHWIEWEITSGSGGEEEEVGSSCKTE